MTAVTRPTGPRRHSRRGPVACVCSTSDHADVLRLRALGALLDVELDLLVLVKRAEPARLNGREMHEYVVSSALLGDEAEALVAVEPLDCALGHAASPQTLCAAPPWHP